MFTGLIREIAKVKKFQGNFLELETEYKPKIGDSIAVNGACLTVVKFSEKTFTVELSPETKNNIVVENLKNEVHIEPAMKLEDRLEGHIVQGHIDTIGIIQKIVNNGNSYDLLIEVKKDFLKFIIPKGSITIDGISLTVNDVFENSFRLTIIPHTMKNSLIKNYKKGQKINIETDMFARYVYHLFKKKDTLGWNEIEQITALY